MNNSNETEQIQLIIDRAKTAQQQYEKMGNQKLFDMASKAIAWALMDPERNQQLAQLAVTETGLGNVTDKVTKNHNKTLGLLRDLDAVTSFGHIEDNEQTGLSTYLRPKGIIAAIVPSTNPLATPVNNIINALKTGNAIIIAPSPKGVKPLEMLMQYMHKALNQLELPDNLVQMVPQPPSKLKTQQLMQKADLVIVTGSQSNVRAGYSSGTPALGVGAGNVVSIIDETANLADAAHKIAASKTFDNATSCSSDNAIITIGSIYNKVLVELEKAGGFLLNEQQTQLFIDTHWNNQKLTNTLLAKDIDVILKVLKLENIAPEGTRFLILPQTNINVDNVLIGEKMTRALVLFKADNFEQAMNQAIAIQEIQGAGHSLSLHSTDDDRARAIAMKAKTCRVIVNQAHCFATGGFFTNGLPFSLSMGCGSWGGNSIDDNLNWKHFVNRVQIVREIAENKPTLDSIFGDYWQQYGK